MITLIHVQGSYGCTYILHKIVKFCKTFTKYQLMHRCRDIIQFLKYKRCRLTHQTTLLSNFCCMRTNKSPTSTVDLLFTCLSSPHVHNSIHVEIIGSFSPTGKIINIITFWFRVGFIDLYASGQRSSLPQHQGLPSPQ